MARKQSYDEAHKEAIEWNEDFQVGIEADLISRGLFATQDVWQRVKDCSILILQGNAHKLTKKDKELLYEWVHTTPPPLERSGR